jgi:hypothetical protein
MVPSMDPVAIWNSAGLLMPDDPVHHLTEGQRALHTTHWIDALTGNGGFLDSFRAASNLINEAPMAFERFGLHEAAELIRQGLALFPEGRLPDDPNEAADLVDALPEGELLEELGNQYYAAVPNLYETFLSYLQTHPQEFPGPLRQPDASARHEPGPST